MPLGVGRGQNVGLRDFCHTLTLLPSEASVFHKHMSCFISHLHRIHSVAITFLFCRACSCVLHWISLRLSWTKMNIFKGVISSLYFWWQFWFFTSCLPGFSHLILDGCSKCPLWRLVNVELLVFWIEFLGYGTISWCLEPLFCKWWILLFGHWASPRMYQLNWESYILPFLPEFPMSLPFVVWQGFHDSFRKKLQWMFNRFNSSLYVFNLCV